MTKEEAIQEFRLLIQQHGLRWGPKVPREAYERLQECNKLLTEADRRAALRPG